MSSLRAGRHYVYFIIILPWGLILVHVLKCLARNKSEHPVSLEFKLHIDGKMNINHYITEVILAKCVWGANWRWNGKRTYYRALLWVSFYPQKLLLAVATNKEKQLEWMRRDLTGISLSLSFIVHPWSNVADITVSIYCFNSPELSANFHLGSAYKSIWTSLVTGKSLKGLQFLSSPIMIMPGNIWWVTGCQKTECQLGEGEVIKNCIFSLLDCQYIPPCLSLYNISLYYISVKQEKLRLQQNFTLCRQEKEEATLRIVI